MWKMRISRHWPRVAGVVLAAAFFVLDQSIPLGVAGGVPYVTVVLVLAWSHRRSDIPVFTIACTALILLGWIFSPPGGELWKVVFNRVLAIYAIWIVALLVYLRHGTEGALRESRRTLSALMSNLPGMAYRCRNDPDWTMEFVSEGCHDLTGYQPEDLVASREISFADLIEEGDREAVWNDVQAALTGKEPFQFVYRITCATGKRKWVWEQGRGIFSETGELIALEGFMTDITARIRTEEALKEARDQLERRVERRTADLSTASKMLKDEVSEREQAERALRESELRFRSLCAAAPVGIFLTDEHGHTIYTNEYLQRLLGLHMEESIVWDWHQVAHPDDLQAVREQLDAAAREGLEFSAEFRIHTPQGRTHWVEVQAALMLSEDGTLVGKVGTVQDITARKRVEKELRDSSAAVQRLAEEQRTLLKNTRDFLYRHDTKGVFNYLSPAIEQITGYTVDEWCNHYTTYLTDNPINQKVIAYTEETLRSGKESPRYCVEIRHKDGHAVLLELNERPYFEEDRIAGIIGVARDITDRARAETALRESEQRLQSVLDNSPAVIYLKDLEGRYILVNRRFTDIFHMVRDAIVGKTDCEIFSKETAEAFQKNDRLVLEAGEPIEFEEVAPLDDGLHTYISLKFPLFNHAGSPYAVCGISTDISERKKVAQELARAKEAAETANRAKSIFLANMSHELRTPFTAMLGAAEQLAGKPDTPPDSRRLDMILRNGRLLLALVDDLLDLSRAETGKLEINRMNCSLQEIIEDALAATRSQHVRAAVDFRVRYETPLPRLVHTDPTRLKQALINLIANALKFTENGHVWVRLRVDQDSPEPRLSVAVEDTGTGIPAGESERIFETFTQVGQTAGGVAGGVGLGLPLARWIAEQLGGDLEVRDNVDRGSIFTLRVATGPLESAVWTTHEEARISVESAPPLRNTPRGTRLRGTILLAEDFPDTRELIGSALTERGVSVTSVDNGEDAVDQASNHQFDLILMDIRMPRMDGYLAAAELRRRGCLTPIIALTALNTQTDHDRVLDAGFDDVWTKPMSLEQLFDRVTAYLATDSIKPSDAGSGGPGPAERRSSAERFSALRIEFIQGLPARLAKLDAAIEVDDLAQAAEVLHQLVGVGGIYEFMPLSQMSALLQTQARNGTLTRQSEQLASLRQAIREVVDSLQEGAAPGFTDGPPEHDTPDCSGSGAADAG